MSEDHRENYSNLAHGLAHAYVEIHQAYLELPLPIRLPLWDGENDMHKIHLAVLSAVERIGDLPVEEDTAGALTQASMHWASATALGLDYVETGRTTFYTMAEWNVQAAFVLGSLALTLLRRA